jgi:hypothetical protein
MMMRKRFFVIFGAIALCSILALTLILQSAPRTIQQAVTNAVGFCEDLREPDALLMLDVMHRRFGIEAFADSLQRYDKVLSELPEEEIPHLRVFRRIADSDNPIRDEDWLAISADIDFFIVPALYCDRRSLPDNYFEALSRAASMGGLQLTHTLLACIWIQENDCEGSLPEGFMGKVCRATAALINGDSVVNEVELEAAAFLNLAGQGALVNVSFVERVVAAQNGDGGWLRSSDSPENSYWHSTVLGLMLLLHAENSSDSYPPMLAPALS